MAATWLGTVNIPEPICKETTRARPLRRVSLAAEWVGGVGAGLLALGLARGSSRLEARLDDDAEKSLASSS